MTKQKTPKEDKKKENLAEQLDKMYGPEEDKIK